MPEKHIKDARFTLSLMVQPDVFNDYVKRKGVQAKGVGFFARCLICYPNSTQGSRQITNPVTSTEHLTLFHQRLTEVIEESLEAEEEKMCIRFSPEAEKLWITFYNKVESEMGLLGFLSDFKDYASKAAENMARIAALLHYFCGGTGEISLTTVKSAIAITAWYVDEYIKLFSQRDTISQIKADADELYHWIQDFCSKNFVPYLRKNTVLQYGPNRFRNRGKANELLGILYSQNRIRAEKRGKTVFIQPSETNLVL